MAGADLLWEKITAGWLVAGAGLVWKKNTEKQPAEQSDYRASTTVIRPICFRPPPPVVTELPLFVKGNAQSHKPLVGRDTTATHRASFICFETKNIPIQVLKKKHGHFL